jgi:hypothetical protein
MEAVPFGSLPAGERLSVIVSQVTLIGRPPACTVPGVGLYQGPCAGHTLDQQPRHFVRSFLARRKLVRRVDPRREDAAGAR